MKPYVGLRLHDTVPGTLRERAAAAKAQGFSCVHLALSKTMGKAYMEPGALTPGLAQRVRSDLDGLYPAVLGCYLNLATPDMAEYRASVRKYVTHLRFAAWMGAGVVGTETGDPNKEYRYDPARSHSDEALDLFIHRIAPVVEAAEKTGAVLAIEPVYTHIVYNGVRAREVLDAIRSPALGIILDPVNLLHPDNVDDADRVIAEAIEQLADDVLVVHMKDYVRQPDGALKSVAAGTGGMDYSRIARFIRDSKPAVHITLEDTKPDNAEQARRFVEQLTEG